MASKNAKAKHAMGDVGLGRNQSSGKHFPCATEGCENVTCKSLAGKPSDRLGCHPAIPSPCSNCPREI